MPYLIDGYNLLHAMGVLRGPVGPTGLEKARRRLLGLLVGAYGDQAGQVTIIFDSSRPVAGLPGREEYGGLHVRYAVEYAEADDLIEALIQGDSAPRQLSVVSDDHRLRRAARQRHCLAVSCEDYLAELERRRRPKRPASSEKREQVSARETGDWLREFADLADDPALKELFEPFDFGDIEPEAGRSTGQAHRRRRSDRTSRGPS